jgi:biotin carboxyl carrier protein
MNTVKSKQRGIFFNDTMPGVHVHEGQPLGRIVVQNLVSTVAASHEGYVRSIKVKNGGKVKKGDALFELHSLTEGQAELQPNSFVPSMTTETIYAPYPGMFQSRVQVGQVVPPGVRIGDLQAGGSTTGIESQHGGAVVQALGNGTQCPVVQHPVLFVLAQTNSLPVASPSES